MHTRLDDVYSKNWINILVLHPLKYLPYSKKISDILTDNYVLLSRMTFYFYSFIYFMHCKLIWNHHLFFGVISRGGERVGVKVCGVETTGYNVDPISPSNNISALLLPLYTHVRLLKQTVIALILSTTSLQIYTQQKLIWTVRGREKWKRFTKYQIC